MIYDPAKTLWRVQLFFWLRLDCLSPPATSVIFSRPHPRSDKCCDPLIWRAIKLIDNWFCSRLSVLSCNRVISRPRSKPLLRFKMLQPSPLQVFTSHADHAGRKNPAASRHVLAKLTKFSQIFPLKDPIRNLERRKWHFRASEQLGKVIDLDRLLLPSSDRVIDWLA